MTKEKLQDLFYYVDGCLYNKVRRSASPIGAKIGSLSTRGYLQAKVNKKTYFLHRLIWIFHNGAIPDDKQIDHIDRDKTNNELSNLRLLTHTQNNRNKDMYASNSSEFTGVYYRKNVKKWVSGIVVGGKNLHLGIFDDKNDAIVARLNAEKLYKFDELHGKISA